MEHEAAHLEDGQPIPVLSRRHFKTVAEGSKEFDRYLKRTLQGGDDEIARRDQWRNDYYQEVDLARPASLIPPPQAAPSRTAHPLVTDSESESSDDSDTESKDDEDDNIKPAAEGGVAPLDTGAGVDEDADFKEYLRFKALMEKNKSK